MKALPHLPRIETVAYDTVDITRQMLQAVHRILYYAMVQVTLFLEVFVSHAPSQCLFQTYCFCLQPVVLVTSREEPVLCAHSF